jgi:hypothetical protein
MISTGYVGAAFEFFFWLFPLRLRLVWRRHEPAAAPLPFAKKALISKIHLSNSEVQ